MATTISDDLSDVAHDLTLGLASFRAGRTGEAIWRWRFFGVLHWGPHAIDALRAITWRVMTAMRDSP